MLDVVLNVDGFPVVHRGLPLVGDPDEGDGAPEAAHDVEHLAAPGAQGKHVQQRVIAVHELPVGVIREGDVGQRRFPLVIDGGGAGDGRVSRGQPFHGQLERFHVPVDVEEHELVVIDGQTVVSEGRNQRSEDAGHGAPVGFVLENRFDGTPDVHDQALNPGDRG